MMEEEEVVERTFNVEEWVVEAGWWRCIGYLDLRHGPEHQSPRLIIKYMLPLRQKCRCSTEERTVT